MGIVGLDISLIMGNRGVHCRHCKVISNTPSTFLIHRLRDLLTIISGLFGLDEETVNLEVAVVSFQFFIPRVVRKFIYTSMSHF